MKRKTLAALLALLIFGAMQIGVSAFTFSEELFTLDIPDGEKVYYFTDRGTNMTGTMLENAQKQDMLCLIGRYSEAGTLLYSFKVERREESAETAAAWVLENYSAAYDLGELSGEEVSGRECLTLSGRSIQNEGFLVKLWFRGDDPAVVITAMYQPEAEEQLSELVSTIQWPQEAVEPPTEAQTDPPDTEPIETEIVITEPTAALTEPPTVPLSANTGRLELTVDVPLDDVICFAAGAVGLALVAGLVLLVRAAVVSARRYTPRHAHEKRKGRYRGKH